MVVEQHGVGQQLPAGRSRKTTGIPSSTSGSRNEWSYPAGTTSSPSTRREHRSRSSRSSRTGSSSDEAVISSESEAAATSAVDLAMVA